MHVENSVIPHVLHMSKQVEIYTQFSLAFLAARNFPAAAEIGKPKCYLGLISRHPVPPKCWEVIRHDHYCVDA